MNTFSLVVCTFMRPQSLVKLLRSVEGQSLYPNEILIIDGSTNNETQSELGKNKYKNLKYYKIDATYRGLTKQRNYGINEVSNAMDVVCFLDDDIVLNSTYFENLIRTYDVHKEAIAVGGYITNEVEWQTLSKTNSKTLFCYDGWQRKEPLRYKLRSVFGLSPNVPPGFLPTSGNGRPISFLPPSNKIYETELFMGGVSSYRKNVLDRVKFSNYFEGYGLYEDAEFCIRFSKHGKLYVNTSATCQHYHDQSGRPNSFKYGKMVVRNGWCVWRTKFPRPTIQSKLKWHATTILLIKIKMVNIFTTSNRKQALNESLGRIVGWWSLLFNIPKIKQ